MTKTIRASVGYPVQATVLVPDKINEQAMRQVYYDLVKDAVNKFDRQFAKTYATFKNKPNFRKWVRSYLSRIEGATETDDKIYRFLNDGTKEHDITPKRAPFLRFRWDGKGSYGAKTTPRVIGSKPARYPKTWQRRQRVRHPGNEARKFDETIQKQEAPVFLRNVRAATPKVARVSGHMM